MPYFKSSGGYVGSKFGCFHCGSSGTDVVLGRDENLSLLTTSAFCETADFDAVGPVVAYFGSRVIFYADEHHPKACANFVGKTKDAI